MHLWEVKLKQKHYSNTNKSIILTFNVLQNIDSSEPHLSSICCFLLGRSQIILFLDSKDIYIKTGHTIQILKVQNCPGGVMNQV